MRSDDISATALKQFFYHWNGFEVEWFGDTVAFVEEGDLSGFPASGRNFTQAYSRNSFAYSMTAVEDWDTALAHAAVLASEGLPVESSAFIAYLNGLTPSVVNRHGGSQYGFGVDNGNNSVDGNRRDKIDDPGEALVITFDLEGELSMGAASGSFGPDASNTFTHTGLHEYARLTLDQMVIRKYSASQTGVIDYLFYDASEGSLIRDSFDVPAFAEYVDVSLTDWVLAGPWTIEHGDILVLAHPTDTSRNLSLLNAELWSMTFDLEFDPPPPEPVVIPPVVSQHPHGPGFSNIERTDGELIAMYRTEAGNTSIRTVTMDFHRGYLTTDNRGSLEGGKRIVFDISDVTSPVPGEPDPLARTLTEHSRQAGTFGFMHKFDVLAPDYYVNHEHDSYVDRSDMGDLQDIGYPPGYAGVQANSSRSAYLLPYHYASPIDSGTEIWDARTNTRLSRMDDHGFPALVMPVGNILLMARIRADERAIAAYDIGDPEKPVLLDVLRQDDPEWQSQDNGAYEPAIYENYMVVPNSLRGGSIGFVDYSDPSDLRVHHILHGVEGSERYMQFQDHRMFAGTEVIDLTWVEGGITPTEHNFPGHKGEYMLPLGNLVVCAENSEQGGDNLGAIYAFQAEPDVKGPTVSYHIPAAGAADQPITSRIGLIIHETLDLTTLTDQTLKVFPVGDLTETSIDGTRTASDKDVITFTPDQPLLANTTYRVVAEGITDISGNPMARYEFDFTTGGPGSLWYPTINDLGYTNGGDLLVGGPIDFFLDATPDGGQSQGTLEYQWDFGDGNVTDWSNGLQTVSHTYTSPGRFMVRARVRSINAPERAALRYIQPSVYFKAAGEGGFEPRFEAENGTLTGPNGTIVNSADSSGGKYVLCEVNSGAYWDFDSVGGAFDFQFRVALPEGEVPHPNPNLTWRMKVYLSEIVDGAPTNEVFLGQFNTDSVEYEYKGFTGYIPRDGRYRIQLKDGDGPREPRVDYVDVRLSDGPVRYEADLVGAANLSSATTVTNAIGTPWQDASGGTYVEGGEGFEIQWDFHAYQAGTYDLSFRASAQSAGGGQMGLFVNGVKVQAITLSAGTFENFMVSLELPEGANTIELRDSEGADEFNVDYLEITPPAREFEVVLPPQRSSQIVLDDAGRLVIAVNPDNDSISAIDADLDLGSVDPTMEWEIDVPADPRSLALDGQGRIWVTCKGADLVRIIDPSSGNAAFDLDFGYGSAPHDILFNNDGTRAFVSLYGAGMVVQLDAAVTVTSQDAVLVDSVGGLATPTALALRSAGTELLVSRFISSFEEPDDHGEVYLIAIDSTTGAMTLQSTIELAKDTIGPDDANSGRGVPNYVSSIAIDPLDSVAYVGSHEVNTLAGTFRDGTTLNHDTTVRSIFSVIDLQTGTEDFSRRLDMNDAPQPMAMLFTPQGDFVFVALQGSNRVSVFEVLTGTESQIETGRAPQGLCFDPSTERLFVKNFMDRSITVLDVSAKNFSTPAKVSVGTVTTEELEPEILHGKQIFYNAEDERMALEGYLSCASCHQDGGHDGVTWDFGQRGEGLRNTTDLRGRAGMAHGNVHWSGNFDEIQDFELDMRNAFGGTGFIESGPANPSLGAPNAGRSPELDALAAYVASLAGETVPPSPQRQADGTLTAQGLYGKRLFEGQLLPQSGISLSCVECHVPGRQLTDSRIANDASGAVNLHDLGTLKAGSGSRLGAALTGIDTPTLWGLHAGAPYLHDGSAATIESVFDQFDPAAVVGESGSAHNLTATGYDLTVEEKAALMAYLHQIDGRDLQRMDAATWAASWGESIGDLEFDFDGDFLSNRTEYLFGGNPMLKDAEAQRPSITSGDGGVKYRFNWRNNDPDIGYTLLHSTDLRTWQPAPYDNPERRPASRYVEILEFSIPADLPREFFMLETE